MANIDDYVNQVISHIKSKSVRMDVKRELEAHINDRIDYYTDAGYDMDFAAENAIKRMGEPEKVAQSLKKIHNNTLYILLSLLFTLLYIVGLIIADVKIVEFGIINLVDFEETTSFSSIASVLIAACGALAFLFARRSKESTVLAALGLTSILGSILSPVALIPFGYQAVSLVTDFPVAVVTKQHFFYSREIFWLLDDLFIEGAPSALIYSLIIVCILISLLSIVVGIISIVLAKKYRHFNVNKSFTQRVKKFSLFLVILSAVTLTGTLTEWVYDSVLYNYENAVFEENKGSYYKDAKTVYDELDLPYTKAEVESFKDKYNLSEYEMSAIQFGVLNVLENEGYSVQVGDYDDDGIYESRRIYSHSEAKLSKEKITMLKYLEKDSSVDEFYSIVPLSECSDCLESVSEKEVELVITVYDKSADDWITFYYINGKLDRIELDSAEELT